MSKSRTLSLIVAVLLNIALICGPAVANAGPFSGTFVNSEGERAVLSQKGRRVSGVLYSGGQQATISGTARGETMRGRTVLGADTLTFTARVTAAGIQVRLQDGTIENYRRAGAAPAARRSAAPPRRSGAAPPRRSGAAPRVAAGAASGPAPRGRGAVSRGRVYKASYEGWSMRIPRGWKGRKKGDTVLLGGVREAGLIMVRASATTNVATLQRGLSQVLAQLGRFSSSPPLRRVKLRSGPAVFAEAQGRSRDGKGIRVRAVGVMCRRGTVAIIGATTTDGKKFAVLRKRVDSIARSIKFFKPKVSPARRLLAGEWYSFTSATTLSGSGGSEAKLSLCPDGRYFSSWDASYQGGAGSAGAWGQANQSGGQGRWRAAGGARRGTVHVTKGNGSSEAISYSVQSSSVVYFNGRKYARSGWKRCR